MNITILAKKGGVGKSTLSLLLYEAFRYAGKTVSIHDWDLQGTSTKALEPAGMFLHTRERRPHQPSPAAKDAAQHPRAQKLGYTPRSTPSPPRK